MRLIRTYPKYAKGFEMLGILREFSGDMAGAESAYSQALYLDPNRGESIISLAAILLQKGERDNADKLLERARLLTGDSPELFYSMACLEAQTGQINLALDHLESAAKAMAIDSAMALPSMQPQGNR